MLDVIESDMGFSESRAVKIYNCLIGLAKAQCRTRRIPEDRAWDFAGDEYGRIQAAGVFDEEESLRKIRNSAEKEAQGLRLTVSLSDTDENRSRDDGNTANSQVDQKAAPPSREAIESNFKEVFLDRFPTPINLKTFDFQGPMKKFEAFIKKERERRRLQPSPPEQKFSNGRPKNGKMNAHTWRGRRPQWLREELVVFGIEDNVEREKAWSVLLKRRGREVIEMERQKVFDPRVAAKAKPDKSTLAPRRRRKKRSRRPTKSAMK
jgi:hypothetical protein